MILSLQLLYSTTCATTLLNYLCKNEVNYLSSLSLLIERTIWLIAIIITIGLLLASFDRASCYSKCDLNDPLLADH
jgi:hypothetical protein